MPPSPLKKPYVIEGRPPSILFIVTIVFGPFMRLFKGIQNSDRLQNIIKQRSFFRYFNKASHTFINAVCIQALARIDLFSGGRRGAPFVAGAGKGREIVDSRAAQGMLLHLQQARGCGASWRN